MTNLLARCTPADGTLRWEDAFERIFRGMADPAPLAPAMDIAESDAALTIAAELPGLEKKDISLTVKDGVLTLRGERRMEAESAGQRYHRIERSYGSFERALRLPDTVDAGRVEAAFRNGVLTITVPKRPETKAASVEISG